MYRIALLLLMVLPAAAAPIRVQITTGGHPHTLSFYSLFENQPDLDVTINPHPSAYKRNLRKFVDVLVLYDLDDVTAEPERKNLQQFLENGGGLVVMHHALADNWQWKWWYEQVVGGRFLMGPDGDMPKSTWKEGVPVTMKPVAKHPMLDGVGTLHVEDEVYKGMWHSPQAQVLMETDNPDNDVPVVWIGPWKQSRVVAIQIGHGAGSHLDPGYRRLVHNAIVWAAGR